MADSPLAIYFLPWLHSNGESIGGNRGNAAIQTSEFLAEREREREREALFEPTRRLQLRSSNLELLDQHQLAHTS